MSILVAVEISETEATLVTAQTQGNASFRIVGAKKIPIDGPFTMPADQAGANGNAESSLPTPFGQTNPNLSANLNNLVEQNVDSTLGALSGKHVLFEYLSLPFNDEKRIEQVVPNQLQDLVPFDIDEFIVDATVLEKQSSGEFEIISTIAPQADIRHTLGRMASFGADPKILTTKASTLTAIQQLSPELLNGTFGLALLGDRQCSLALFINGQLKVLRELPINLLDDNQKQYDRLCADIRTSIARLEHESKASIEKLFLVGNARFVAKISELTRLPLEPVDLSRFVEVDPRLGLDANELGWAVGLFAHETLPGKKTRTKMVDFRRGPFAFKPAWGKFLSALQEEREWIGLVILWALIYLGSIVFTTSRSLTRVDSAISQLISTSLPGVQVPLRRETEFLDEKIADIESQLQELGSLSSVSPLDALTELSQKIPNTVQVSLDSLSVSHSGLVFAGSVPDVPSVGKLSSALESMSGRFCEPKVDTKGKVSGSSRLRFAAEVKFCD